MKLHSVTEKSKGYRLDLYMISIISDITRTKIQSLIKANKILINKNPVKPSYILKGTEAINYTIESIPSDLKIQNKIISEPMELNIIFEDKHMIVINKAAGLVVHPGAGNHSGTLLNGVIDKIDSSFFVSNPGLVHRLDKETSGVIIIAKNYRTHSFLSKQFEERSVKKIYHALVWGNLERGGTIKGNIIRNPRDRKSFILTTAPGRDSSTDFKIISNVGPVSYVELEPKTGRTHQIRVHMKSVGHPILSDRTYSGGKSMIKSYHVKYTNILKRAINKIDRVALHAKSIEIIHPSTKKKQKFTAPVPDDMKDTIKILECYE